MHDVAQKPDQGIAFDETARGIEQKTAVDVAILGKAKIGVVFDDGPAGGRAHFRNAADWERRWERFRRIRPE